MNEQLQKKISQSIKLLQASCKNKQVELCYSGGKDSDVILQLAKEAGIDFVPIYKCTTIDPPGTIKHARDNGARIIRPKRTFFDIVKEKGLPSRFARFCCSELKEYKVMDTAIVGVRRSESPKRAKLYTEPTQCRIYSNKEHVNQILPLLDWTNSDIRDFILDRGIKCHPLYYDEGGNFIVKRRLGCMGCPLGGKAAVHAFLRYPKLAAAYIRAAKAYYSTEESAYQHFYRIYFNILKEDKWKLYNPTLFEDKPDIKKLLEDFFHTKLP